MTRDGQSSEWFTKMFEETHLDVFKFAAWLNGGDTGWAEDITAETYRRAWEKRDTIKAAEQDVLPWLIMIARNLFIDGYRKASRSLPRKPNTSNTPSEVIGSPESLQIKQEEAEELWRLLSDLRPEEREMLVLRYVFEWQVKDIAERLDIKPNTVSVTIQRSLARLGARWGAGEYSWEAK